MTYTINENAKNVWIRDNENTQDLSLQTEAKLVYLNNGRTLEQELGEGSMVSNVATVDKQMTSVIDGTFDGAYESCVLEGRTLVNILPSRTYKFMTHPDDSSCYSDIVQQEKSLSVKVSAKPSNWLYVNCGIPYLRMLKPNTKYMVIFDDAKNISHVQFLEGNSTGALSDKVAVTNNRAVITTNSLATGLQTQMLYGSVEGLRQANATFPTEIRVTNARIIEYQDGLENVDIPYFEGMCDVKMPILRNVGKNLFDKAKTTPNKYIASTGAELDEIGTNRNSTDYIRVSPNSEITLFGIKNSGTTNSSTQFYIAQYGENKELIKCQAFTVISDSAKLTTDSATRYIRTTVKDDDLDRCQIEQGSTSTTYEDYKTNILHTSDEVVLRSLPSGVKDTYNALTGEYVQRVGEMTLKGNEEWYISNTTPINTDLVRFDVNMEVLPTQLKPLLCDKLPYIYIHGISGGSTNVNQECITNHSTEKRISLIIRKDRLTSVNKTGLNTYLQSNPITIQYPLTTPIKTTIKSDTIPFAYANGHVILESGYNGQSLLPTLKYSTVINRTGQIVGMGKTLLKQEKQLSDLEKLLIRGVINLDYNNTLMNLNLEIDEVI